MNALYTEKEGYYLPGPLTQGPWSPDAQHGGPVAALLARAVENVASEVVVQVVRLTVELLRPVPLSALSLGAELVRAGRRVQLVEAVLRASDTEVARARALRIRVAHLEVPVDRSGPPVPLPSGPAPQNLSPRTAFVGAVDLRFARGGWDETGPVTMWTRLVVPVVEGEEPSPLQRAAAAADFCNGVSRVLDFESHTFINPDLTVALARVPEGEWIGYDAVTRLSPDGYGQAEAQIFDAAGPVGRSVQSLIVASRQTP